MIDLQALQAESGGLFYVHVLAPNDLPDVFVAALSGDKLARQLLEAAEETLQHIGAAPRKKPTLCVSCPRPIRKGPFMLGFAAPGCDAPTKFLGFAICDRCSGGDANQARAKAMEGMRRIWPDLRSVEITHPTGGQA